MCKRLIRSEEGQGVDDSHENQPAERTAKPCAWILRWFLRQPSTAKVDEKQRKAQQNANGKVPAEAPQPIQSNGLMEVRRCNL